MGKCDECGGNLTIDFVRAEGVCDVCSLVHNHVFIDAETNSNTSLGEGRHNEKVNNKAAHGRAKLGGKMSSVYNHFDGAGNRLSAKTKRRYNQLVWKDRALQRDTDPMFSELMSTIQEMFGRDLAGAVEPLARATARKLTPQQEVQRKKLTPGERRRLKCPKTSICRAGGAEHPEYRGVNDRQNLQIMGLAIASIAAKWFGTVDINEKTLMATYGITSKQLINARKVIMQHYKERVRLGWAPQPNHLHLAVTRADEFNKVAQNLADNLAVKMDEPHLDEVMETFHSFMNHISEPSVDATTSNISISMLAGCVMYNILTKMGLHGGKLTTVANAVQRSGAGIKNRLVDLKNLYEKGEFEDGAIMFNPRNFPMKLK